MGVSEAITNADVRVAVAFAENNMNMAETAKNTNYHRNSILYHLNKLSWLTEYNPRTFCGLVNLLRFFDENGYETLECVKRIKK